MLTETTRRQDFPTLMEMTYLNTAAEGIPPLSVGEALHQYFRDHQLGMDGRELHFAQREAVKELTAGLYGLTPDEIGICTSSSEAYNLAAMALQLQPGDEVIINDLDYPAGYTPWLQTICPATVKRWNARDWVLHPEDLIPLLSSRTRLINLSLVSFFNGFLAPLPAIIETVRRHSPALIAVDVTQALGRIPLDLQGVDLIVSSTHKWILASHGGGLVGVPQERADVWTVPAGGWFNLDDPFGPERFDRVRSLPGAASFTLGMPNYPAIYAIRAGLAYIQEVGVAAIDAAARPLVEACLDGLSKMPVELITPREEGAFAGIVAFLHPKAEEIHRRLHAENIHIMHHAGRLRVSIHGYNTMADIEHFLQALERVLQEVGAD